MFNSIQYKALEKSGFAVCLIPENAKSACLLSDKEFKVFRKHSKIKKNQIFNRDGKYVLVSEVSLSGDEAERLERLRKKGFEIAQQARSLVNDNIAICGQALPLAEFLAFAEGLKSSFYRFHKYKKEKDTDFEKPISLHHPELKKSHIEELTVLIESNFLARDWINEPLLELTAEKFSASIKTHLSKAGVKVKILNKKEIEKLGMGGVLGVNKGSVDPPTFNILEWKPKKAVNKQPFVLVGKGLVFDTGGLSLKPTKNSMDKMKCDMGGGAAVAAGLYGIAKLNLPIHVITLIPATDNRPGGNAITPGDILTMMDGSTVEVLNTDAEGRLILADALAYAKQYKPMLVMDFATLTGTAKMTTGHVSAVYMGNADVQYRNLLKESGEKTAERVAELPFYDEYKDYLKSEIADLQNVGGADSGSITAGKFLEHFTDYPFIHVDIAGTAFLDLLYNYRGKQGSGFGAKLIIEFAKKLIENAGQKK